MTGPLRGKRVKLNSVVGSSEIPSGVMQTLIMHALELPPISRELFILCDVQRANIEETAKLLGITQAVANRSLKRARERMRNVIERLGIQTAAKKSPSLSPSRTRAIADVPE